MERIFIPDRLWGVSFLISYYKSYVLKTPLPKNSDILTRMTTRGDTTSPNAQYIRCVCSSLHTQRGNLTLDHAGDPGITTHEVYLLEDQTNVMQLNHELFTHCKDMMSYFIFRFTAIILDFLNTYEHFHITNS